MTESVRRPASEIVAALSRISTATIHEALGRLGDMDPGIVPLGAGAQLCGPAFPVACRPADNLMIHYALAVARRGDVLVVSTGEARETGCWGLLTTRSARQRGLSGLIIDGSVRDSAAIEQEQFPVFCRGRAIKGTSKVGLGRVGIPITVGGQTVAPGDIVVGDRDGVVVVPSARAAQLLDAALARDRNEQEMLAEIDRGTLTIDLLGLRSMLEQSGLP